MAKNLLFSLFLFLSLQTLARVGDNKGFSIISQELFNDLILSGGDIALQRFIVVPSIDSNYKDIVSTTDEMAILAKFSYMLQRRKYSAMEKYMAGCDASLEINSLIAGLYSFSRKQYIQAFNYLERVESKRFTFLKQLLIADCRYELLLDKSQYKPVLELYQAAMDCATSHPEKVLVSNRLKYLKYM
jgi:hypothetical protein